jgi:hypothetical protein
MRGVRLAVLVGLAALSWFRVAEANSLSVSGNVNFAPAHIGFVPSPTLTLTLSNDIGGAVINWSISESCTAFSVSPMSGTLAASSSTTLTVTFIVPATRDPISQCTVTVVDPVGPDPTFTVDGDATAARLSAPAATIDMGSARWNTPTTTTASLTVTNIGDESIALTNISVESFAPATHYAITNHSGFPIAPGGTGTYEITFSPSAAGTLNSVLTLSLDNDQSGESLTRNVTGVGTQSFLTFSPASPFLVGAAPVGSVVDGTLTLQNLSANGATASLDITAMTITGSNASEFSFENHGCTTTQTCSPPTNNSPQISTNATDGYLIRCTPADFGTQTATLTVVSNDASSGLASPSSKSITLDCSGNAPSLGVSPAAPMSFGNQRVGGTSPQQNVTISNGFGASTLTYTISSGSSEFVLSCAVAGCLSGSLVAGASVAIGVQFAPSATGARSTNLLITTNDPDPGDTTRIYAVNGTGTASILGATSPMNFGSVDIATLNGVTQNLTLNNTGTASLNISRLQISGDPSGNFTFAFASCPSGQDCNPPSPAISVGAGATGFPITLRCDPSTIGAKTATLVISSDDPASPRNVGLSCNGTAVVGVIAVNSATPVAYTAASNTIDFGAVLLGNARATTLTIGNSGNTAVNLGAITFTPNDQGFTSGAPSSTVVPAGGSVTVVVTFTPTANTQGTAVLGIASDWNALSVNVIGDGQDVGISLNPGPAVNFGLVPWDTTPAQTIRIQNAGQAPAPLSSIALLGNAGGNYTLTGVPGTLPTLAANGSIGDHVDVFVTATPNANTLGTFTATLDVRSTLPPPADVKTVSFTYTSTGPGIELTPGATVDFGGVDVDLAGGQTIPLTIRNSGNSALQLTAITSPSGPFTIAGLTTPVTIPMSATSTIMVTYDPSVERSAASPDTSSFVITNGGYYVNGVRQPTALSISLTGWGTDRHIALKGDNGLPALDFGAVYRNPNATDPRAHKTLHACNTGEAVIDVTMVTDPAAPFDVTGQQSFVIPGRLSVGGESCVDVIVEFHPTAYGDYTGVLQVMNNDDSSPLAEVTLAGRGVARPVLVTPDTPPRDSAMNIPRITIGTPVRLTDILPEGMRAMNQDANDTFRIRLEVVDGANIARVAGTHPTTIAPGATDTFDFEFEANEVGVATVVVNVFLDDDDQVHDTVTIELEGVQGDGCCNASRPRGDCIILTLSVLALIRRRRDRTRD